MQIQVFTFNQFFENTIIVFDKTKECVIIDPGCYTISEKDTLQKYISTNNLIPVKLINTHCHIDHILGNNFIAKTYDLELEMNANDMELIKSSNEIAQLYGFTDYEMSPLPKKFLNEGDTLEFGNSQFKILFTPGHAPGHISLYSEKDGLLISGDVLFNNSIGRTDLPGGNYDLLIESIKNKILTLNDNTIVYCGHGPSTTIGNERLNNPFLK
ncbi:MAG: MBL fold hydrolase [Flavobacteriales bacterium]|nr:MBL fold hydrolase [Flavobacteriales bacterium]|tara:strand:- start:160 stop:798 length:639 start_codon:yes stop_codon:yes gene_type:complete